MFCYIKHTETLSVHWEKISDNLGNLVSNSSLGELILLLLNINNSINSVSKLHRYGLFLYSTGSSMNMDTFLALF